MSCEPDRQGRGVPRAARAAGRLRDPQSLRCRHSAHPGGARLRGARHDQRRLRLRPRGGRTARSPATRPWPMPGASSRRRLCRFRPISRTAIADAPGGRRADDQARGRSGARRLLDRGCDRRARAADLRSRPCGRAHRGRGGGGAGTGHCPFTLTARAENFLHGRPDLDDTIRRLQAFEAAGADVLYAPGLREGAAIRTVCASLGKPVNVIMGLAGDGRSRSSSWRRSACAGSASARRSPAPRSASSCVPREEVRQRGTFTFAERAVCRIDSPSIDRRSWDGLDLSVRAARRAHARSGSGRASSGMVCRWPRARRRSRARGGRRSAGRRPGCRTACRDGRGRRECRRPDGRSASARRRGQPVEVGAQALPVDRLDVALAMRERRDRHRRADQRVVVAP